MNVKGASVFPGKFGEDVLVVLFCVSGAWTGLTVLSWVFSSVELTHSLTIIGESLVKVAGCIGRRNNRAANKVPF